MNLIHYRRKLGGADPDNASGAEVATRFFAWVDDPASNPIAPEDTDLTAIADTYSRVQIALALEQSAMDHTRKNELWEEIMRKYPSTTPTPSLSQERHRPFSSAPGSAPGSAPLTDRKASHPRGMNRNQCNWQTALNIALIVVLLLGITGIVWNRDFINFGGSDNDARPQLAMSGPIATPGGTGACDIVSGITQKAETRFARIQQGGAPPAAPRSYSPAGPTASKQFDQLGAVYTQYRKCAEQNGTDQVPFPIATDRYIWEHDNPNLSPVQLGSIQQQQHDAGAEIARWWTHSATLDASLITVGSFYPLQPDSLLSMRDGRIGAIVYKRTFPLMKSSPDAEAQASFAPYFIAFEKVDAIVDAINDFDIFKVDEFFPLCDMRSCPPGLMLPIVVNQPSPVPGSPPAASPVTTPIGRVEGHHDRT